MGKGSRYIRNLAVAFMGRLGITITTNPEQTARGLYLRYNKDIAVKLLREMRWDTIGTIASYGRIHSAGSGKTSLYEVHQSDDWLTKCQRYGGQAIILEVAVTAIIAEMNDVLRGTPAHMPGQREIRREIFYEKEICPLNEILGRTLGTLDD